MFKKILIANRGEIALRIIRACKRFDPPIMTVAVYSDADRDMPYVKVADEAHYLGDSAPSQSYLNSARILEIATHTKADAIHPGYGFLSENDLFATRCAREGIKFIGPPPETMEAMSRKVKALRIAKNAGVPTLKRMEWSEKGLQKESDIARKIAKRIEKIEKNIGYPLIIKPDSGGGGIGMLRIDKEEELLSGIATCKSQAKGSFGNNKIYIEQYLANASHIEVQILADADGNIIHLFERDCSVQRRNQKLIEEAPSLKLNSKVRKLLCHSAINIVKKIKKETGVAYTGAGTLEFLMDSGGNFYFLEMNTRLQVEHGITEMITGIDIVEWQIRIAAGERLPFRQKDIKKNGHAIEVRIYPEVWDRGRRVFIPQASCIELWDLPQGLDVRVDSALNVGDSYNIPTFYEGLIMKIMAWGQTRGESRVTLLSALDRISLKGASTNRDFLMGVVSCKQFVNNAHTTKMLEDKESSKEINIEIDKVIFSRLTRSLQKNIGILN